MCFQNAQSCNPNFAKFIQTQETRPEVQSKLSALLITPIQRVPRYKLLLKQLCELTTPKDSDYVLLQGKKHFLKCVCFLNKFILFVTDSSRETFPLS